MLARKRKTLLKKIALTTCNKLLNITLVILFIGFIVSVTILALIIVNVGFFTVLRILPFLANIIVSLIAFGSVIKEDIFKKIYLMIPILLYMIAGYITRNYYILWFILPNLIGLAFFKKIAGFNRERKVKEVFQFLKVSFIVLFIISMREYMLKQSYKNICLICFYFAYVTSLCLFISLFYGDYRNFLVKLRKELPFLPIFYEIYSTTDNIFSYLSY